MKLYKFKVFIVGLCLIFALNSCGKNLFSSSSVSVSTVADAQSAVTSGHYQEAIDYLTTYVADNPTDYTASQTLVTAYTGLAGLDTAKLTVALAGGALQSNVKGNKAHLVGAAQDKIIANLFEKGVLPEATAANVEILAKAISVFDKVKLQAYYNESADKNNKASIILQVLFTGVGSAFLQFKFYATVEDLNTFKITQAKIDAITEDQYASIADAIKYVYMVVNSDTNSSNDLANTIKSALNNAGLTEDIINGTNPAQINALIKNFLVKNIG